MKTIHHLVDVDATTDSVWTALTREDRMAGWWSTKVDAPNARVGTLVRWTFAGDFNPVMEIITLDERHELIWRCNDGHGPWKDGTFRFQLVEQDASQTRLRFSQDYAVELADDAYGIYNFNWGYYLESLRLFCTTGVGKPYPPSA